MKSEGGRRKAERSLACDRDWADRRRGMTLFELLLVLVLLVVVASLAAPLLDGSFASVRLRRGTDQVLAAWSQARAHAIESGQIYQFRFRPEDRQYRVEPWSAGLERDALAVEEALDAAEITAEEAELKNWQEELALPEEIVFNKAESVAKDEFGERSVTRLDQESTDDWSAPILFYPDGTTSVASLLLKNSKGLFRRATLRSLTGVGRASDLLTREEVDRNHSP